MGFSLDLFCFLNCSWAFNYLSLQAKYVFHHEVGY